MRRLYCYLSVALALAMACAQALWAQETPAQESGAPAQAKENISSDSITLKVFENWTTPSLKGSDLKALDVIPGDIDTVDGVYTHEVTRVLWRPGDPIDLYIIKPVGVKNPPVILYLYSYPFENDRYLNHDFCKFLVRNGFAAVGFASALTGQRYHDRPMKEWFVSELRESLADSAHDVQMVLNYLETRGDLDMNRVGMFGDGSGASIAILSAAVDPRIKTLDLLDPWGDWPDWVKESTRIPEKERPTYLNPGWLAAAAPLDPVKWLPQLKTQKVRLQFVKAIGITPADVQKKIEAAAPANVQIVHYDNEAAFRSAVAGGTGFDWIKEQLQPGSTQQQRASRDPHAQTKSTSVSDSAQ